MGSSLAYSFQKKIISFFVRHSTKRTMEAPHREGEMIYNKINTFLSKNSFFEEILWEGVRTKE